MELNDENYFSTEMSKQYMGVSQYKQFMKCEAAAMAEINGTYKRPMTEALMVGSYVDAFFEGTLDKFIETHPEILKRDGSLKAPYVQADETIKWIAQDDMFMKYMSGKKQVIMTADLFGTPWKIKIDSYLKDMIVDLKYMRSLERVMGKDFVTHWGYDIQMAIYSEVEKIFTKSEENKPTYLAVITKETPPDKELIHIPQWRRDECLEEVRKNMPRILAVKRGEVEAEECGICPYCRTVKKIKEPIDFELVGYSNFDRKTMEGVT